MAISPPRSRARAIGKCDQDSIKIALTSFSPRFAARSSGVSTRRRRLETTRVAPVYCLDVFARLTRAFNSSSDAVKLAWPCAAMSIASARPWWCRAFRELAWTSGKIFIARPQLAVFGCPVRPIAAFHVRPFTVRTVRPALVRAESLGRARRGVTRVSQPSVHRSASVRGIGGERILTQKLDRQKMESRKKSLITRARS